MEFILCWWHSHPSRPVQVASLSLPLSLTSLGSPGALAGVAALPACHSFHLSSAPLRPAVDMWTSTVVYCI